MSILPSSGLFRRSFPFLLPPVLGLFLLSAQNPAETAAAIDALMRAPYASATTWGIYVQDVNSGDILYGHNAGKALLPASTQKLLTTAAALTTLGQDYRYQTTLYFRGTVEGSTLVGDLIIRGSGDPSFGSVEVGRPDPLRGWARALASMGIKRIHGRIIGDDDALDDRPYAEGWDVDFLTNQSSRLLGVSTSGLAYNDNVVVVRVSQAGRDSVQRVEILPPGFRSDVNEVLMAGARRAGQKPEHITITGDIPLSFRGALTLPVTDPTVLALQCFVQHLREAGIAVAADVIDVDRLPEEPPYDDARPLMVHLSPPLADLLDIMNKESNNFYAEQIFRTFAFGGGAAGGERRIKDLLRRAGANDAEVRIQDGCGLSRKDLVTPEALGKLLVYMYRHPERTAFMNSLARGGERGSTLSGRLTDVQVAAKTGSLEGVRALAGYTRTTSGRVVAFAVVANNFTGRGNGVGHTIDEVVRAVAR